MEKKYKRRYTVEFQKYAVERMRVCVNISTLAKELGVWRRFCCIAGGTG